MAQLLMMWLVLLGSLVTILAGAAAGLMLAEYGSATHVGECSSRELQACRTGQSR